MTTREIANTVGKDERSVRRWVNKAADKMSTLKDKMSLSSPTHPADYDLDETLAIIEAGLGKNAADVYRANATGQSSKADKMQDLMQMIPAMVAETIKQLGLTPQAQPLQITTQHTRTRLLSSSDMAALRKQFIDGVHLLVQKQKPNPINADYRTMYNTIYYNIMVAQGTDIKAEAYKADMQPIDWAEANGYLQYCVNEVQNLLRD